MVCKRGGYAPLSLRTLMHWIWKLKTWGEKFEFEGKITKKKLKDTNFQENVETGGDVIN